MTTRGAFYRGDETFTVEDVEVSDPGSGEVQINVAYCGICGTDLHIFLGHMDARVGSSRIPGHEMSGTIAALGEGVTGFEIGEPIVVRPLDHCGECPACRSGLQHICHNLTFIGIDSDGAFQQKWNVPAHTLHRVPDNLTLAHAALVEPMAVACHDVARGRVAAGDDVLVIGGGPIGMLIATVARSAGAKVTVAEINENRLAFARAQAFDTLDPRAGGAQAILDATGGKGADVVFEVSGSAASIGLMTDAAAARGRIVMVAIHTTCPPVDLFRFFWRELEMVGARVYEPADYDRAMELLSEGVLDADAFITDMRSLDSIQSAFQALTSNPAAMKTMIRVSEDVE